MSVDKFKFISPGIFINEIDNTGRARAPRDVGPVLIGRSEKGPILRPVRVESFFDFVNIFGNPLPGGGGGDIFRDGNYTSPTYAPYAAQAWFRNNPVVTFVRIGGKANAQASDESLALAGWQTTAIEPNSTLASNGGAFGLFVTDVPSSSGAITGSLNIAQIDLSASAQFVITSGDGATTQTIVSSSDDSTSISLFRASGSNTADIGESLKNAINSGSILTATADGNFLTLTAVTPLPGDGLLAKGPQISVSCSQEVQTDAMELYTAETWSNVIGNGLTGTMSASYDPVTGTLAAIWYIDTGASVALSGTFSRDGLAGAAASTYVDATGDKQFKVQINDSNGVVIDSAFNFNDQSGKFIRKVFNTNPILTNSAAVSTTTPYWLGESFEGAVNQTLTDGGSHIGVILPLMDADNFGGKFRKSYDDLTNDVQAQTGWFFAQDLSTATGSFNAATQVTNTKLFKVKGRHTGDWITKNLKVSIADIKASVDDTINGYGTFSVVIREINDIDNRPRIVEQFNNCNLNPNSENFIARKIGDRYEEWDDADRRYKEYGDYPNRSRYIYVHLDDRVKLGTSDPVYLPYGVEGPLRFVSFNDTTTQTLVSFVSGNFNVGGLPTGGDTFISGAAATNGNITFNFPELRLRISGSEGNPVDPLAVYYGVDTTFNGGTTFDASVKDHLRIKPSSISDVTAESGLTEISYHFTLDDMCFAGDKDEKRFVYKAGSRAGNVGGVFEGVNYLRTTGSGDESYKNVINNDVDKFTTLFHGGTDGLDITETEPLRVINQVAVSSLIDNYMFNSVQVAIDSIRDPEKVEYNLAAMPGIVNNTLNTGLINMCEDRGDSLAIVDLKDAYVPQYESTLAESSRIKTVNNVVDNLEQVMRINSSYGAAYFPWVQIQDINNGQLIWAPPSIAAIGAMSYSQKSSALWFAPAGFTRGGLSDGKAGLPVVAVRQKLISRERDKLYDARINPIASFPAEGIVMFGQKTLQVTQSALDRINVRRLMIYLKRQVSRFAATILFDQNVQVTWDRFKGRVEPFLRGVQAGLGITGFKLVLDETTTTPDLIDRNILYAKIYIKPARAIEFIAIDFILTDTGAAFED